MPGWLQTRAAWLALTAVVLVGAAVAVVAAALPRMSSSALRTDEALVAVSPTGGSLLAALKSALVYHASSLFALLHWLALQFPGGVLGLRIVSLVAVVVALPAFAALASRLVSAPQIVLALLLLVVSPALIATATVGAGYATVLATTLWGVWGALRLAARPSGWRLVAAGIVLGAVVFVYTLGFVYAFVAAVGIVAMRREEGRPLGLRGIAALGIPWLVLSALGPLLGGLLSRNAPNPVFAGDFSAFGVMLRSVAVSHDAYILLVVAAIGAFADLRTRPRRAALLVAWTLAPALFVSFVRFGALVPPYGFTVGRPPGLIDDYVSLSTGVAVDTISGLGSRRIIGAWIFESPSPVKLAAFDRQAAAIPTVATRPVGQTYALITNRQPLSQSGLRRLSISLSKAWADAAHKGGPSREALMPRGPVRAP